MKRSIIFWGLGTIAVVAIIVVAIVLTGQKPPTTQPTGNADTSQATQTATITYTNSGFSPNSYAIKAGGTVTVKNQSSHDLQFSSGPHPVHTAEPELNMSVLRAGESGTFKVTKVGTWSFHNHLNEEDTGNLEVVE